MVGIVALLLSERLVLELLGKGLTGDGAAVEIHAVCASRFGFGANLDGDAVASGELTWRSVAALDGQGVRGVGVGRIGRPKKTLHRMIEGRELGLLLGVRDEAAEDLFAFERIGFAVALLAGEGEALEAGHFCLRQVEGEKDAASASDGENRQPRLMRLGPHGKSSATPVDSVAKDSDRRQREALPAFAKRTGYELVGEFTGQHTHALR